MLNKCVKIVNEFPVSIRLATKNVAHPHGHTTLKIFKSINIYEKNKEKKELSISDNKVGHQSSQSHNAVYRAIRPNSSLSAR